MIKQYINKVEVDLSIYATKADLKNAAGIDTSNFKLILNLVSLKTEVDKLGIEKLVPVPADLSKLSDAVKNDVAKKTALLVAKVNNIDVSRFPLKTKYYTDKSRLDKKIRDTSGIVKKKLSQN